MPNINPFLWFDNQAEEAAALYTSVFPNSKVINVQRYPAGAPGPEGSVMTIEFELDGQPFTALNGGRENFSFNEAISFTVNCQDQDEVDTYWEQLTAGGGEAGPCGWLKDRFGVSWQIVPQALPRLLADPDREKANRVMQAMMQMSKIEVQKLEDAARG